MDDMLGAEHALADQTRIPINPKGEELDAMRATLAEEAAKKAAKKAKKARKARMGKDDDAPPGAAGRLKRRAKSERNGCDDLSIERLKAQAKKFKAGDHAPQARTKTCTRRCSRLPPWTRGARDVFVAKARKAW